MYQVLFHLPIYTSATPDGVPIYGFGLMLFLTFVGSTWLAGRLAKKRDGVPPERVQDMAIWLFVAGLIGARITYMIQYDRPLSEFFQIWQGGIVFYGSFIGGWCGYLLFYHFVQRKLNISTWKLADSVAPALALGLVIGRIGCLLNGCCYGAVCDPSSPQMQFPLATAPVRELVVEKGHQTALGFGIDLRVLSIMDDNPSLQYQQEPVIVSAVEPGSAAAQSGLKAGDIIVKLEGHEIKKYRDLVEMVRFDWPRGKPDVQMSVLRAGHRIDLPAFTPRSLGLHPTQLYESVSMLLLMFLLLAYYPLRRHDGQVLTLFMVCYAVHRYLNEVLRDDTTPVAFGLTLSQNISIGVVLFAIGLEAYLWSTSPSRWSKVPGGSEQKPEQNPQAVEPHVA